MHLQFLGTSAGLPTKARNVSATAVIEATGSSWYLVDCGEATQHQLLHSPLSLRDLRAIFITHVHGDHCFGLPGLLASASMSGRTEPLPLILPAALHDWLRLTLAVSDTWLSFELQLQAVEDFAGWGNGRVQVSSVALSHRVPSHGYVFTEVNPEPRLDIVRLEADGIARGPLWGELAKGLELQHEGRTIAPGQYLRASRKARKVIVCGDNDRPELLAEVANGADILVHEATFTQSRIEHMGASFGHSSAASIAAFAEAAGVANLVLTHFSARYQADPRRSPGIEDIRAEAQAYYSGCLVLAQDLQRYQLGKDGRLLAEAIGCMP